MDQTSEVLYKAHAACMLHVPGVHAPSWWEPKGVRNERTEQLNVWLCERQQTISCLKGSKQLFLLENCGVQIRDALNGTLYMPSPSPRQLPPGLHLPGMQVCWVRGSQGPHQPADIAACVARVFPHKIEHRPTVTRGQCHSMWAPQVPQRSGAPCKQRR